MYRYIKILIAGIVAVFGFELFGFDSYPILQFMIFIAIYMGVKFILDKMPTPRFNFKNFIIFVVIVSLIIFLSTSFYIWYTLNTAPIQKSFLESYRVQRLFKKYDLKYDNNISNSSYLQLTKQYRKDLKNYYRYDISSDIQKDIWENYKNIYKLQVKIQMSLINDIKPFKIVDTILEYRYIPTFISSSKVKGYLQTYSNNQKGAVIPLNFDEKSHVKFDIKDHGFAYSVTLPYFNNSLPINKKDKEYFVKINKYLDATYQLLQKNRQQVSVSKLAMKHIGYKK